MNYPEPIRLNETTSTNSYLADLCQRQDVAELTCVYTAFQSAGRGQRGNSWESEPGKNLLFSFVTYPDFLEARRQFLLSQVTALALQEVLSQYAEHIAIKWPNDIYAGDRKISGMLVENSLSGENVRTSVIGIGLNVNQTEFPTELPNPVSMALLTGEKYGIESLLDGFMDEFTGCLSLIEDPAGIRGIYESLMYRIGTVSRFCDLSGRPAWLPANAIVRDRCTGPDMSDGNNGPEFDGIIRGITEDGRLEISLGQGITGTFSFKEIAFVI